MDLRKQNKGVKGNKGGGRASAFEELKSAVWHSDKWELDSDVPALQAKLKTGKYSVRDVFLAKALQGNERVLTIFANKLLADLVDVRGKDGAELKAGNVLTVNYLLPDDPDAETNA